MTERELIKKLNRLKIVKPSSQWKTEARGILYNQICQGEAPYKASRFEVLKNIFPFSALARVSQPVWAVVLIMFFAAGSAFASVIASQNSKPGDSLYIAKIISEKARATFAFNEKERVQLGVEFASNRAKEITQVLQDNDKAKDQQVEQLSNDFKTEIKVVKSRLAKMGAIKKEDAVPVPPKDNAAPAEEDNNVFGADAGKDNKGMQLGDAASQAVPQASASKPADSGAQIEQSLDEAEKMFDEKDYNGTVDKLAQASQAIQKIDNQAPANDNATSTTN